MHIVYQAFIPCGPQILMKLAAEGIKKVSFELGGSAPLIVFNVADIKVAVASTVAAKFRNAGQTCVCPNRIFVQDKIHDQFVEELANWRWRSEGWRRVH